MRFVLLLLIPLALASCDGESARKLVQKVGSLAKEASQKSKDTPRASTDKSKEKEPQTQAPNRSVTPSPSSQARPNSMHQALQQLEGQRRTQEKVFKDQIPPSASHPKSSSSSKPTSSSTSKSTSSKPSNYQGFPGFEK